MKKGYYWFAGVAAFLILTWVALRLTGVVQWYVMPTNSGEATIPMGSEILASSMKKPQRMDFICYRRDSKLYTHRLVGVPGDTLEIRNAVLYVNGKDMDSDLHLARKYAVSREQAAKLKAKYKLDEYSVPDWGTQMDSSVIFLDQLLAAKEKLPPSIYLSTSDTNPDIEKVFIHHWNQDQFGPLVVPADTYFVMGDNRENSMDSRYVGFIPKKYWVGTVFLRR